MYPAIVTRGKMSSSGPNDLAQLTIDNGIAEFRFTNPANLNRVTFDLVEDMKALVHEAESVRDEFSAVLWTAEGDSFCAGLHTDMFSEHRERIPEMKRDLETVYRWMYNIPIPVIAAARGHAAGAGATFLCYLSDLQVVTPDLEFWYPEVSEGVWAGVRTVYLLGQIGQSRAVELMVIGKRISGREGQDLGLFTRVAEDGDLEATAHEMAKTVVAHENAHPGIVAEYMETINNARDELLSGSTEWARRDPVDTNL
jgi:enoyl-CoA hydratase/carnithine racemase